MSEEEAQHRQVKQKYLKEQLKMNNWDPEEFSEFLDSRRENGTDIDVWEFDELIDEVQQYKKMKGQIENQLDITPKKINYEANSIQNRFARDLRSNSIIEPAEKRFNIVVLKDDKVSSKITMRVLPKDAVIKRDLSDIYWLRSKLQIEFPFYYIPPVKAADYKDNFIQNFFSRLMDMKFIKESEALKTFIDDSRFIILKNPTEERNVPQQMFDKISKMFSSKSETFEKNNQVYDTFLSHMFANFMSFKSNLEQTQPIFRSLNDLCQSNAKIFSTLKHLSYELSEAMDKCAETLWKIAKTYKEHMTDCEAFEKKVGFKPVDQVKTINKKVHSALHEWGVQFKTQKSLVIENLANLFHFKKHEYLTISQLIETNADMQEGFKKKWLALEEKKKSLFASKNVEKWKLDMSMIKDDFNSMIKSYSSIKPFMLPEETAPLLKTFQLHLFLNKHVLFEYINFYLNSQFYTEQSFTELTEKALRTYQSDDTFWNKFGTSQMDISQFDRESTITMQSQL